MTGKQFANTSRWLLVRFRGRSPKGGVIFERRVFRYGQRIDSRKRYSSVVEIGCRPLRKCVWAHHQHGVYGV